MNAWRTGGRCWRVGRTLAWLLVWLLPAQAIGLTALLARGPAHRHADGPVHASAAPARHFHRGDDASVLTDAAGARFDAAADDDAPVQAATLAVLVDELPVTAIRQGVVQPGDTVPALLGRVLAPDDRPPIPATA